MVETLTAVRFQQRMSSGKTRPILLACEDEIGGERDVVVKLDNLMERRRVGLVAEAIAYMFASDLGLLVPTPYFVRLEPDFVDSQSIIPVLEAS